ncbi:2126_t:CDS:2, partial [Funneliformis mosseae]
MVSSADTISSKNVPNGTAKHKRIINVTHMIPYTPVLENSAQISQNPSNSHHWVLKPRRGHSALYSGLNSLSSTWNNHYVGYIGTILDSEEKAIEFSDFSEEFKHTIQARLKKENIYPVFLENAEHHGHYDGYCKYVLWPLFHYILWDTATDGRVEKTSWDQYVKVNKRFTDKIVEIYKPGDLVWIHDYHLLLVPEMLREILPDAAIGLFIHAPFPSSEIFR